MNIIKDFIITIGREYGSSGKALAEILGKDLDIKVYDKNIIGLLAGQKRSAPEFPEVIGTNVNAFESFYDPFFDIYDSCGLAEPISSCEASNLESQVIREAVAEGPAIFVGRCADDILRGYPDVVRVFVFAPAKDRALRIMEKEGISDIAGAEKAVRKTDKARKTFYQLFSERKWGFGEGMDLMINSSVLGIDGSAELIEDFFGEKGVC